MQIGQHVFFLVPSPTHIETQTRRSGGRVISFDEENICIHSDESILFIPRCLVYESMSDMGDAEDRCRAKVTEARRELKVVS